jgi:hypothetical protein
MIVTTQILIRESSEDEGGFWIDYIADELGSFDQTGPYPTAEAAREHLPDVEWLIPDDDDDNDVIWIARV